VVCRCLWSRNLSSEEALTHKGLLRKKRLNFSLDIYVLSQWICLHVSIRKGPSSGKKSSNIAWIQISHFCIQLMWCKKVKYLKYSNFFANIFINVIDLDIRKNNIKIFKLLKHKYEHKCKIHKCIKIHKTEA